MLLGAGGMVARDIRATAPQGHELLPFTHSELDVCDSAAVSRAVEDAKPDWVINASGITDVDRAERDPDLAFAVNATAVGELAKVCRATDSGLVHFSTDFIFDGTKQGCYSEDDQAAPLNAYGASKLKGEQLVHGHAGQYLIIRTQWVFGVGGTNFLSRLWQCARDGIPTSVIADQFGCCTYARDLAEALWDALGRLNGTYHIANRGRVSRFDIAHRIFTSADSSECLSPWSLADAPGLARRPSSTPLCLGKLESALARNMPYWTDALDRYLVAVKRAT